MRIGATFLLVSGILCLLKFVENELVFFMVCVLVGVRARRGFPFSLWLLLVTWSLSHVFSFLPLVSEFQLPLLVLVSWSLSHVISPLVSEFQLPLLL